MGNTCSSFSRPIDHPSQVGAACGDAERLQLLVHYLRRVYCFDYPSGRLLPSQGEQP